jgi:hypothetical protein
MWSTTNSRWEIRIDADWDGVSFSYESLAHHNSTFASTPNPPTLGSGTWVGDGGASGWPDYGCGDLGMSKKQLVTLSIE